MTFWSLLVLFVYSSPVTIAGEPVEQQLESEKAVSFLDLYNQLLPGMDLRNSIADQSGQTYPWSGVDHQNIALMDSAARDIERHRKGDFRLTIVDEDGEKLDVEVEVQHIRHEFKFGANTYDFSNNTDALAASEDAIKRLFNASNVCNYLQEWWDRKEQPYGNWGKLEKEVRWCEQLELDPRFHIIQYVHMRKPRFWLDLNSEQALWDFYTKRVEDVAERYEGEFFEFDVMNEMVHWPIWFRKYHGAKYGMSDYFAFDWMRKPENGAKVVRQARKYLPDAKLVVLETGVWNTYPKNVNAQNVHRYYERLIELEAPFDVVGYQGRYPAKKSYSLRKGTKEAGPRMFYMDSIEAGLKWFSKLGKEISITEFSPPTRIVYPKERRLTEADKRQPTVTEIGADRKELALWVANFHILAFSKPYINQVTWWEVFRQSGGKIDAGLINADGSLTEIGKVMDTLINQKWRTQLTAKADAGGLRFRGFYGEYLLRAEGYQPKKVRLFRSDEKEQTVTMH